MSTLDRHSFSSSPAYVLRIMWGGRGADACPVVWMRDLESLLHCEMDNWGGFGKRDLQPVILVKAINAWELGGGPRRTRSQSSQQPGTPYSQVTEGAHGTGI